LSMPSRLAASAPRTTAGYRAVAALRKAPWGRVAPRVAGSAASVASKAASLALLAAAFSWSARASASRAEGTASDAARAGVAGGSAGRECPVGILCSACSAPAR